MQQVFANLPDGAGGRHVVRVAVVQTADQLVGREQFRHELFVDIFRATKSIFISNPAVVYAKYTGGDEHTFVSERDLESAIGAIGNELQEQYLITYVPNNKDEGGFHQIAVTVDRPDVKIRTRPGYWIAAQN